LECGAFGGIFPVSVRDWEFLTLRQLGDFSHPGNICSIAALAPSDNGRPPLNKLVRQLFDGITRSVLPIENRWPLRRRRKGNVFFIVQKPCAVCR
jgi:hypothetical protein